MVGAAPLSAELTHQFTKVLPQAEICQGYGMTETCTTTTMVVFFLFNIEIDMINIPSQTPIWQRIGTPGSAGQFLPGVKAKIVKPDGSLAGYDEPGELVVTGPEMSLKYTNDPEA